MKTLWVPGVNISRKFGRWAFEEFTDVFEIERHSRGCFNGTTNWNLRS